MDSIYLYGALEAAMNFDLENDPDMVAIEANLDTIDYALESARLEYDMSGDDRYVPVIEAAEEKQKGGIKDWFSTMAKKISLFVKNAIQSVRMMLSRVANAVRLKKANKMSGKLKDMSLEPSAKISGDVYAALSKGLLIRPDVKINELIGNFIETLKNDGSISKEVKQDEKDKLFNTKRVGGKSEHAPVNAAKAKYFLDDAVKYLSALGKSFPKAKERINQENANGVEKGIIRVATTSAYNVVTSAVKEYYSNAMKVANAVCKTDKQAKKDAKKSGNKAPEAPKTEEKKA